MKAEELQKVIKDIRSNKDDEYQLRAVYNCINKDVEFYDFCVLKTELLGIKKREFNNKK